MLIITTAVHESHDDSLLCFACRRQKEIQREAAKQEKDMQKAAKEAEKELQRLEKEVNYLNKFLPESIITLE